MLPGAAYEVRESPCGGRGVFATQEIRAGDFIMLERPVISVVLEEIAGSKLEDNIKQKHIVQPEFDKLSASEQAKVMALTDFSSNFDPTILDKTPTGIFLTNAIPGRYGASERCMALCCQIALFNHSCSPNAYYMSSVAPPLYCDNDMHYVRATRNIEAGEEICVHYFAFDPEAAGILSAPALKSCEKRKALLLRNFGAACACSVCSGDAEAVDASDKRRVAILNVVRKLNSGGFNPSQVMGIEVIAHTGLTMAMQEGVGFHSLLREFAEFGRTVCRQKPKHPRGPFWFKVIYEQNRFAYGEHRPATLELKRDAIAAAADAFSATKKGLK